MNILEFMKRRADLQSLMLSVGCIFAGTGAAVLRGNMEIMPASLCLLFAIVLQIGCNLYYYYSFLNRQESNKPEQRIPGVNLKRDDLSRRILREGSIACLILSLMIGFTLMGMAVNIWWALAIGIMVYGIVYLMVIRPEIYRSAWSLILTFLIFGPIGVMATCFMQYQYEVNRSLWNFYDASPALFLGPAMGFLACSHHIVMSYFNHRIDPDPDRPSLIRFIGYRTAEWLIALNGIFVLALFISMALLLNLPYPLIAIVPGVLAFLFNTYIPVRLHFAGVGELRHINDLSRINYLLTGLLCLILWAIIGAPDDSVRVIFPN